MMAREARVANRAIPLLDLGAQRVRLGRRVDDAVARVMDHGSFIMGPEVAELEDQLARYCGAKHVITCSSGTDALLMVLLAWGVGPGTAVFVPAFTFAATAEVVALLGATPVFVDVDAATFTIRPGDLEDAHTAVTASGLDPVAVIPVDLYGQTADYGAIRPVAARLGLKVLADAAQSFGATDRGLRVGTFGHATAMSFFPAKPLGCYGDGGAVATDDAGLAEVLSSVRAHGRGENKYDNVRVGLNARLDTIQAAVLIEKLAIFPEELERRAACAAAYSAALEDVVGVPALREGATSAWAQYTITTDQRERLVAGLREAGVATAVHYPKPLHRQTAYSDGPYAARELPVSEALADQVMSLPLHPYLASEDQQHVVRAIRSLLRPTS